jgi:alpha-tubulin suppressor-like RCC1 family protein
MPGPVFVRPLSTPIKLMENVKRVITSGNDIFVINDNDELWGWGSNFTGDMGDGTR